MKIYYIEPFFGQSHKEWICSYQRYSSHEVEIFSLSGRFWKWRMQGGAISLADQVNSKEVPDLFLISGMIDLPLFMSLLDPKFKKTPISLYFHENQFVYPEGENAKKNQREHYSFINFKSALVADKVYFNSRFNKESFFDGARELLKKMPDLVEPSWIERVLLKSKVLPLGIERKRAKRSARRELPLILWNHRWEHDKNPEEFFKLLYELKDEGVGFELAVVGQSYKNSPEVFNNARGLLDEEIVFWGFQTKEVYLEILETADLMPVTSHHDFFGISVVEATMSGVFPILPNRLAYPENFPNEFLYTGYSELKEKTKKALLERPRVEENLINNLKRFDWEFMVQVYDEEFLKS